MASNAVPDIVDIDLTNDGDVCNREDLKEFYQQNYLCAARKAVGLEKLFVVHMDTQWQTNKLVCALSNKNVHLASIDTLAKLDTFLVHDENIIDVHFSPVDHNILFTGSNDGRIRTWDLRATRKYAQEFKVCIDDQSSDLKPLLSFDVNSNGQLLCAGTEKIKSDSFVIFWDLRSSKFFGSYDESHQDDISHVQFHPNQSELLATCSTDLLINIFDTNQNDEDDALLYCLNTEACCGRLQWLTHNKTKQNLSVLTHTEEVQIWDIEEAAPFHSFSRDQLKNALKRRQTETCYAIRCFQTANSEDPLVLAGSCTPNRGCLRLLKINGTELEPYAVLEDDKGYSQTVRCASLNPEDGTIISGGEDGIINVWKHGVETKFIPRTKVELVESPKKKSSKRSSKPYSK